MWLSLLSKESVQDIFNGLNINFKNIILFWNQRMPISGCLLSWSRDLSQIPSSSFLKLSQRGLLLLKNAQLIIQAYYYLSLTFYVNSHFLFMLYHDGYLVCSTWLSCSLYIWQQSPWVCPSPSIILSFVTQPILPAWLLVKQHFSKPIQIKKSLQCTKGCQLNC